MKQRGRGFGGRKQQENETNRIRELEAENLRLQQELQEKDTVEYKALTDQGDEPETIEVDRALYERLVYQNQKGSLIITVWGDFLMTLNEIDKWTQSFAFAALGLRGDPLKLILTEFKAHDLLAGRLLDIAKILDLANREGIEIQFSRQQIDELARDIKDFAQCCQRIQNGESDGNELLAWIDYRGNGPLQQKISEMRQQIKVGGAPKGVRPTQAYILSKVRARWTGSRSLEGAVNLFYGDLKDQYQKGGKRIMSAEDRDAYDKLSSVQSAYEYVRNLDKKYPDTAENT